MNQLDVTVVVTAHNCIRHTALCLASLRRHWPSVKIIVVDHDSSDETETYVNRACKTDFNLAYLRWTGARNLAKSWNMGYQAAKTRFVVVSNNDVVFTAGWLERVCSVLTDDQLGALLPVDNNVALVPVVPSKLAGLFSDLCKEIRRFSHARDESLGFMAELDAWWPTVRKSGLTYLAEPYYPAGGFCFAVDKQKLSGPPFNETYTYYGEDWDFFARLLRRYKMARDESSLVWHFGKATSSVAMRDTEAFDALMASRFKLIGDHEGQHELVSVVVPVKDRPQELKACLASVIAQTFPHWRCYVVNDGSTDRAAVAEVCDAFQDPRIGMWDLPLNLGPSAARNHALARTKGKYVAFLDSDDEWNQEHLSLAVDLHSRQNIVMSYCVPAFSWRWWDKAHGVFAEKVARIPTLSYFGEFDKARLAEENFIITSTVVVWGDLARAIKFDESLRFEEDWRYFQAIAERGEVIKAPRQTVTYHQQPDGDNLMKANVPNVVAAPQRPEWLIQSATTTMKSPVTVIIPTVGRPSLLAAVESVGHFCPIIVVCDSELGVREARRLFEGHESITILASGARGPSAARNQGARLAVTPWLKFLDDDDLLCVGWLTAMEPRLKYADVITLGTAYQAAQRLLVAKHDDFVTSGLAVRRSVFQAAGGFNEEVRLMEERELMARLKAAGRVVEHLDGIHVVKGGETTNKAYAGSIMTISSGERY